jgi:ABC-type polysaccharide/polyol phosphate export permease
MSQASVVYTPKATPKQATLLSDLVSLFPIVSIVSRARRLLLSASPHRSLRMVGIGGKALSCIKVVTFLYSLFCHEKELVLKLLW